MNAREKRLRRQYYDFELYFNGITESDDADLFLWLNAAALVKASGCSRKNDLICRLQESALSDIYGTRPLQDLADQNEEYTDQMSRYRLSSRVGQMGIFWKEMIRRGDRDRIRRTILWLDSLHEFFLPTMFHLITKWETEEENYTDALNMRGRKKAYNQYRRDIAAMRDLLVDIMAVFDLIGFKEKS